MKSVNGIKKWIMILTLGLMTFPNVTLAREGGAHGGGGKFECNEYSDILGNLADMIMEFDQAKLNKVHPLLSLEKVQWAKLRLECDPVTKFSNAVPKKQDRDAWSSYDKDQNSYKTELKYNSWKKASMYKKIDITIHELMVLIGAEEDKMYRGSLEVKKFLIENSINFKRLLYSNKVVLERDGSTTLLNPKYLYNENLLPVGNLTQVQGGRYIFGLVAGDDVDTIKYHHERSTATGICKYFGFSESNGSLISVVKPQEFAVIDADGNFLGTPGYKLGVNLLEPIFWTGVTFGLGTIVTWNRLTTFTSVTCK